jgi:hypothetical protein
LRVVILSPVADSLERVLNVEGVASELTQNTVNLHVLERLGKGGRMEVDEGLQSKLVACHVSEIVEGGVSESLVPVDSVAASNALSGELLPHEVHRRKGGAGSSPLVELDFGTVHPSQPQNKRSLVSDLGHVHP